MSTDVELTRNKLAFFINTYVSFLYADCIGGTLHIHRRYSEKV